MWQDIEVSQHTQSMKLKGFRVVEAQNISATLSLVDTHEEHELLEAMIEESKPPQPPDCDIDDYLLFTPFRYPPLREGTRFGKATERSLFYGAEELETAFCEVAHRRFSFMADTEATIPPLDINYTSFRFHANSSSALSLITTPFDRHDDIIHHPSDYTESQNLGTEMREAGIEMFTFKSVRRENAINIALFTPAIFTQKSDKHTQWTCQSNQEVIHFLQDRKLCYSFTQ